MSLKSSIFDYQPAPGVTLNPSWAIPDNTSYSLGGVINCSYNQLVDILCFLDNEKFKGEPYKAIFDMYGFTEKAESICFHYARVLVNRLVDSHFSDNQKSSKTPKDLSL